MTKAVIFDMDGLMINSEEVTFECYQEALKSKGLTMSREFYVTLLGSPVKAIYEKLENEYKGAIVAPELIKEVHALMAHRFETEGVPLKKGLIELLTFLKDNNYKTIVATSSNRSRVDTILSQADIEKYFDDSICGDEVTKGKPNPEVFLRSCEKLGVETSEAVVLEDSEAGIQAAHSGNIRVICVPDMKYPVEPYASMTTKIVDSLLDVIDFLKAE